MKIAPLHSKYNISDSMAASGSHLILKVNSELWINMRENEENNRLLKEKYHNDRKEVKKCHKRSSVAGNVEEIKALVEKLNNPPPRAAKGLTTFSFAKHAISQFFSGTFLLFYVFFLLFFALISCLRFLFLATFQSCIYRNLRYVPYW